MKRYGYLIPQIVEYGNMSQSFYEVVGGLPIYSRPRWQRQRDAIIADLSNRIRDGTFRITDYEQFEVTDGPKVRTVQSPSVPDRIGCNAIMRVVERYVYKTVVRTSAASIKGRGMHYLHNKVVRDIQNDKAGTRYYYKCDIKKFYESIDQDLMKSVIRRYIKDPLLLDMIDSFIVMMEHGLSIGLRSSQCFGNILLSSADHDIKERVGVRHYYRYCDDVVMMAGSKKALWRCRDEWHKDVAKLGLRIKADESVKPLTEGLDFLGYVTFPTHSLLRKRTKQNAARKLHKVKSRKRRTEIIGSFKGMAKWGNCKHLYKVLTGNDMKNFKDLGLHYTADDGKKRFEGKQTTLRNLVNIKITIVDYETDVHTENGPRTVVSFQYPDGELGKYFTADKQQLWYLEAIDAQGEIPFATTLKSETFGNGKVRYYFT